MTINLDQAKGLFALAGIDILGFWELTNQYWPDAYEKLRAENPWFLFKTKFGLVKVGPRKRVIVIDWSDTPVRRIVTEDDVTKTDTMVHAYSLPDAARYMQGLREGMDNEIPVRQSKLTEKDENIIKDILKFIGEVAQADAMVVMHIMAKHHMTKDSVELWLDEIFIKLGNGRVTFEEHGG